MVQERQLKQKSKQKAAKEKDRSLDEMVFSDSENENDLSAQTLQNLEQMQLRFGSDLNGEMAFSVSMPMNKKQIFKLQDQSLRRQTDIKKQKPTEYLEIPQQSCAKKSFGSSNPYQNEETGSKLFSDNKETDDSDFQFRSKSGVFHEQKKDTYCSDDYRSRENDDEIDDMLASDDDEDRLSPYSDQHDPISAGVKINNIISPNIILPKDKSEVQVTIKILD